MKSKPDNRPESPKAREIRIQMAKYFLDRITPKELSRWLLKISWSIDDENLDEDVRGFESSKVFLHYLSAFCYEFIGIEPSSYQKVAEAHLVLAFSTVELFGENNWQSEGTYCTGKATEFIASKYLRRWRSLVGEGYGSHDFMTPLQTMMDLIEMFAEYVYETQTAIEA
jgi:hypothetical protein